MDWLWTWQGKCFGYRDGDNLWTHDGRHVGRFDGDTVFDRHGNYLGELVNKDRLIRKLSPPNIRSSPFTPWTKRVGYVKYTDYVGYVMYAGYEDFPAPENL